MKLVFAAASAAALLAAAPAMAQDGPSVYINGGYAVVDAETTGDANFDAIALRGGVKFTQHLGIEAEGHIGVTDADVGATKIDLDSAYGVYVVGFIPASEKMTFHGRIGFGNNEFTSTTGATSTSRGYDSINYGIGGTYMLNDRFGLRGDYTRIDNSDSKIPNGDANVFSLSLTMKLR